METDTPLELSKTEKAQHKMTYSGHTNFLFTAPTPNTQRANPSYFVWVEKRAFAHHSLQKCVLKSKYYVAIDYS